MGRRASAPRGPLHLRARACVCMTFTLHPVQYIPREVSASASLHHTCCWLLHRLSSSSALMALVGSTFPKKVRVRDAAAAHRITAHVMALAQVTQTRAGPRKTIDSSRIHPSRHGLFAAVAPKPIRTDEYPPEASIIKHPPPGSYDENGAREWCKKCPHKVNSQRVCLAGRRVVPNTAAASSQLYAQRRLDLCLNLLPQTLAAGPGSNGPRVSGDPAFVWSSENWQRGRGSRFKATIHELPPDSKLQVNYPVYTPCITQVCTMRSSVRRTVRNSCTPPWLHDARRSLATTCRATRHPPAALGQPTTAALATRAPRRPRNRCPTRPAATTTRACSALASTTRPTSTRSSPPRACCLGWLRLRGGMAASRRHLARRELPSPPPAPGTARGRTRWREASGRRQTALWAASAARRRRPLGPIRAPATCCPCARPTSPSRRARQRSTHPRPRSVAPRVRAAAGTSATPAAATGGSGRARASPTLARRQRRRGNVL